MSWRKEFTFDYIINMSSLVQILSWIVLPHQIDMSLHSKIDLIPRKPVIFLTFYYCELSREAANTSFAVFGWTRPGLEHTTYRGSRFVNININKGFPFPKESYLSHHDTRLLYNKLSHQHRNRYFGIKWFFYMI